MCLAGLGEQGCRRGVQQPSFPLLALARVWCSCVSWRAVSPGSCFRLPVLGTCCEYTWERDTKYRYGEDEMTSQGSFQSSPKTMSHPKYFQWWILFLNRHGSKKVLMWDLIYLLFNPHASNNLNNGRSLECSYNAIQLVVPLIKPLNPQAPAKIVCQTITVYCIQAKILQWL